jgi:methylase of polypeptide subunit release factors
VTSPLIASLASDLGAAGFTVDRLTELWGDAAAEALHRGHRVPAIRALAAGEPSAVSTLATAFVLGMPVAPSLLDQAFPTLTAVGAVALGLVTDDGQPLVDLRPYSMVDAHGVASWWIASDPGELALGRAIEENHVLGVGGASTTLSGLLVPADVDLTLDLGTGCGIQALHAARYATRVIATDISERALTLARFNAELNSVTTIEFRLGSLFEPVAGEQFGHIISNPPFVITPRSDSVPDYEYRDGGLVGDAIVASLIRSVYRHLLPGGIAQFLGNWECGEIDGLARVESWVADTELDAWVVERERQSVEQYAETWIRDGGTRPGPEFDRLYGEWLDDFASRGVTEVGFGYLALRRPLTGAPTFRRFERYGHQLGGSLGDHIASVFAAHDWLEARDDAALSASTVMVAADVTEERHYWPGEEHPTALLLRQGSGFARTIPLGTVLAAVVGACDGELTIEQISAAVAEILSVDSVALAAEVLPELRELVLTGFLLH